MFELLHRYRFPAGCFIIFVIAIVARLGVLCNNFVSDDFVLIFNNEFIRNIENLFKVLNPVNLFDVLPIRCGARPITVASFIIDFFLFGFNSGKLHILNLLLHSLNAVFIFNFVYHFADKRNFFCALSSALFFSLHPIQSEAVNVISFRADLLFSFFSLISLNLMNLLCINPNITKIKKYVIYLCMSVAVVLAFLSKENAIALPFLLILIPILFYNNKEIKFISVLLAFLVFILFVFFWIERFPVPLYNSIFTSIEGNVSPLLNISLYIKTILVSLYYNIIHILYPVELSYEYFLMFSKIKIFIALIFIIVYIFLLFSKQISKNIRFFMLFVLVSYLPVSNIIPLVNTIADRYMYFVMTGISVFFGLFATYIYSINKKIAYLFLIILMMLFCFLSFQINKIYNNTYSLYKDAVEKAPYNVRAVYNMGMAYYANEEYVKAIAEFDRTFSSNNLFMRARIWMFTGLSYEKIGNIKEARKYCHKAFLLEPLNEDISSALFSLFDSLEAARIYVLQNTEFINDDINKALSI